jgi:uncharacterized membrane protein YphA (DoxX/SURF4 family)
MKRDLADASRSGVTAVLMLRVLLGCWFLFSGGMKVFGSGIDRFTRDVANYRLVGEPWDAVVAFTVPWAEIVAGLCLMLGILRRGAILTIGGLVVVFATAVAWAWFHQLNIACGCHGGDAKIHYWGKAAEFTGYAIALAWLWRNDVRHGECQRSPNLA